MALSDRSIREQTAEGHIIVDDDDTQTASIDLHLNRCFLVFSNSRQPLHRRARTAGQPHRRGAKRRL